MVCKCVNAHTAGSAHSCRFTHQGNTELTGAAVNVDVPFDMNV